MTPGLPGCYRPSVVTDTQLAYATQLREGGATIAEITDKTGLTRSTLYRHPRPAETLTADAAPGEEKPSPSPDPAALPLRRRDRHARTAGISPPRVGIWSRTVPTSPPSGCTSTNPASRTRRGTAPAVNRTATSW
ncbi:helix-turn-helix domain-containing protein [Rhodococcus sp. WB9]|uniref:helix-turn-helix domain-containing protein n=1 Tax=Rhodococcus sp. WB9 TaxID=2594007 RepID=UPI0028C4221C|nr:helix-turn-helix domain-containing protein [Rhodococcus sp. WB9]